MVSARVLTAWPVDAEPWPVVAMALMLALRAVSAATEFAVGGPWPSRWDDDRARDGVCGLGPAHHPPVELT